ncbi:hypothetical protein GYMLUDRAFT_42438 [Collybiopsis luxurians FD-317 M1]|uniref:2'-phosphotransferase n=1 Tax=Collybiopsis luxurians FD-317 M1 TaxID=944289 RepID=A0A0D0BE52_9AGAR|nr:hypothetical protein GYMLUDRAFT_42438 [Collybiopsis luxurians FD-317 M1]
MQSNTNNRGGSSRGRGRGTSSKLRGLPKDTPAVQLSKTLSWLLRHGAQSEGLAMRPDGYVRVADLLDNSRIKATTLTFRGLQDIVQKDSKQRYSLVRESESEEGIDEEDPHEWWIKANQGHSIKNVQLTLKPILTIDDIPSRTAVHGTTKAAWKLISTQGLSKMSRNHIHLAQGVSGDRGHAVISGMRSSCDILIYINIPLALASDIKFYLSDNGVVLTEGNERGFLEPKFFSYVEQVTRGTSGGGKGKGPTLGKREVIPGWEEGREERFGLGETETVSETQTAGTSASVPATSTLVAGVDSEHGEGGTSGRSVGLEEKLGEIDIRR